MVLHGQELSSTGAAIQVIIITKATVQVVAGEIIVVMPQCISMDARVAGAATVVVIAVIDHVVANTMTTIQAAAVVKFTISRTILVSVLEQKPASGEIVHRFGPRLGRRIEMEECRLLL